MPTAFADAPVTGGLEGTRMLAALALSLGIHAGFAALLDLPGHSEVTASSGTVQVRLVHAGTRTVLSPVAPAELLMPLAASSVAVPVAPPALRPSDSSDVSPVVPPEPVSLSGDAVTPSRVAPASPGDILKPVPRAAPDKPAGVRRATSDRTRQSRHAKPVPAPSVAAAPEPPGREPETPRPVSTRVASASPGVTPAPVVRAPPAVPPRPLSDNPRPRYPMLARRRGQQGRVLVRLDVDASGTPSAARVVSSSGVDSLDEAARDAVSRWRFEPARREGRAEAATVDVPVKFRLDGRG